MARLRNEASVRGTFGSEIVTDTAELIVELSALTLTKTADKEIWLDTSPLSYELTIANIDPATPGVDVTGVTFTDQIDINYVTLNTASIQLNGATIDPGDYQYDPSTGLLEITLPNPVVKGSPVTITFQVNKNP